MMSRLAIGFDDIGIGGALSLSCVAREVKLARPDTILTVRTYHPELYTNNPHVDHNTHYTDGSSMNLSVPAAAYVDTFHHYHHYLCTSLGIFPTSVYPEMYYSTEEIMAVQAKYKLSMEYYVLHAQASNVKEGRGRWTTNKDWYSDRWEEVIARIDVPIYQIRTSDEPYIPGAIDTVGTTVREACSLVAGAELLMGCISFPMHVAAGSNTRAVIVYGGREHPNQTGYPDMHRCIHTDTECSPCHMVGECPHGRVCMDVITPNVVYDAICEVTNE